MNPFESRFNAVIEQIRINAPEALPDKFTLSDQEIEAAEKEINIQFPDTYKWFLKNVGDVDFPYDVYGFRPKSALNGEEEWGVVVMTMSERHEVEPHLAPQFVPLTPNGFGDHWCLDTSKMVDNECPVVFWNHELDENQEPPIVAATFLEWLEVHVDETELF